MGRKKNKDIIGGNLDDEFIKVVEYRTRDITKEEFLILKTIHDNQKIPLYEISKVSKATGLNSNKILDILKDYTYLSKKFKDIKSIKKRNKQ